MKTKLFVLGDNSNEEALLVLVETVNSKSGKVGP